MTKQTQEPNVVLLTNQIIQLGGARNPDQSLGSLKPPKVDGTDRNFFLRGAVSGLYRSYIIVYQFILPTFFGLAQSLTLPTHGADTRADKGPNHSTWLSFINGSLRLQWQDGHHGLRRDLRKQPAVSSPNHEQIVSPVISRRALQDLPPKIAKLP